MTNKNRNLLIIASVVFVLLIVVIIILIIRKNRGGVGLSAGRLAQSSFKRNLIDNATNEFKKWGYGSIKETDANQLSTLETYWKNGAGVNYAGSSAVNNPWSAAFISYMMKISGAGSDWPYAAAHSVYIQKTIQNRKNNSSNPFKGYRVNEVKVEPGDLICASRNGSGANYDTIGGYESHCDLVVDVSGNVASSLGGNVSQSVSKTDVPLNAQGMIDMSKTKKLYFVVIKNQK